ncbi:MAG TPA: class I SAM-dependent methyltransferase [Xanthomonadaceae bacterium]|nr:class I SAM-dependent methyltransferase [Xanthomonadaceae bacterium]
MAQITSGLRRVLSVPVVYNLWQNLVGAKRSRSLVCSDHFRVAPGQRVVDVGCGTGEILDYLPEGIAYYGFDLDPGYIRTAQARYEGRGHFTCADITSLPADAIPPCDLAIAFGLLHHLDDDGARALLAHLFQRLAPGGRLVTIDGVWVEGQSALARALIARDRGQNVRDTAGYLALVPAEFSSRTLVVRHDLLRIPSSLAIMECTK